jgi:hypothetical protein
MVAAMKKYFATDTTKWFYSCEESRRLHEGSLNRVADEGERTGCTGRRTRVRRPQSVPFRSQERGPICKKGLSRREFFFAKCTSLIVALPDLNLTPCVAGLRSCTKLSGCTRYFPKQQIHISVVKAIEKVPYSWKWFHKKDTFHYLGLML